MHLSIPYSGTTIEIFTKILECKFNEIRYANVKKAMII